jgi:hypothetical protein
MDANMVDMDMDFEGMWDGLDQTFMPDVHDGNEEFMDRDETELPLGDGLVYRNGTYADDEVPACRPATLKWGKERAPIPQTHLHAQRWMRNARVGEWQIRRWRRR